MRRVIGTVKFMRALLLFMMLAVTAVRPFPQSSPIVGTWALTGADKLLPDGTRVSDYGPSPHGLVIFTADGFYSVQIYRADRAKFSSEDKHKVSPEEYREAALGMSVHFGRYAIDETKHTISFHIDRASWPNWDDTVQVREYQISGDELSWKVAPRPDGSIPITVLRRVRTGPGSM